MRKGVVFCLQMWSRGDLAARELFRESNEEKMEIAKGRSDKRGRWSAKRERPTSLAPNAPVAPAVILECPIFSLLKARKGTPPSTPILHPRPPPLRPSISPHAPPRLRKGRAELDIIFPHSSLVDKGNTDTRKLRSKLCFLNPSHSE